MSTFWSLQRGDRVLCHLAASKIVEKNEFFDETRTFEVVSKSGDDIWVFIPHYLFVKESRKITKFDCRELKILSRFLDEEMVKISEEMIVRLEERMKGMNCNVCEEFFEFATSNQSNGTLICFSCRLKSEK